jgi:hypothetical protein
MSSLFFSYSHKDEALRDRLEVHLASLKRSGAISTWHDRRIIAGDPLGQRIDENLERADIILLLISPISSLRLLPRHQMQRARGHASSARNDPVILKPAIGAPLRLALRAPGNKPITAGG